MEENRSKKIWSYHFDSNRISKMAFDLIEQIQDESRKGKDFREISGMKALKKMCGDDNLIIANTGLISLQHLVKLKILNSSQVISILISMFPSVTNHSPIINMIGKLFLIGIQDEDLEKSYNMTDFQHPMITILKHDKRKFWPMIFNFVQYVLYCYRDSGWFLQELSELRPLFRYISCDPSSDSVNFKMELLSLFLNNHCSLFGSFVEYPLKFEDVQSYLLEALAWQKMDMHYCQMLMKINNYLLSDLEKESIPFISAVTPYFALAVCWLIKNGHNPTLWIDQIKLSLKINSDASSLVLLILTDVVCDSSVPYVNDIISLCNSVVMEHNCHKLCAYSFAAANLKWLVHPAALGDLKGLGVDAISKLMNELLAFLNMKNIDWSDSSVKLFNNEGFLYLKNSHSFVTTNANILKMIKEWDDDGEAMLIKLQDIKNYEISIRVQFYWLISGIVLCHNEKEIVNISLDILGDIVKIYPNFSHSLCALLLFKLSHEKEPFLQLKYLLMFLELPVETSEVPVIIRIMESFTEQNDRVIIPVAMRLYLSLWKIEQRIYPYLQKLLNIPCQLINEKDWEINVGKAAVMAEICRFKPETYGKDLVPLLSNILNTCGHDKSGMASALAMEAITELCKAHVIDIGGTWKALRPKLTRDDRRVVKISLCKMFAIIPTLKIGEDEELIHEAISTLWSFITGNDFPVAKAAMFALSKFPLELFKLKLIPEKFRRNVTLPNEFKKEEGKNPEDILPYVPGICWVQFLEKIDPRLSKEAQEFLISLIEMELESFPRGIFYLYPGKAEPLNYSYLPHRSISRALVDSVKKFSESPDGARSDFIKSAVFVLSHEYSKVLPPLNWSFLENVKDDYYWKECLSLAAKQAPTSVSAKKLSEELVKKIDLKEMDNVIFLYSILPKICNAVQPNLLRPIVDESLRMTLQSTLEKDSPHFKYVLEQIKFTLTKDVLEVNKNILAGQLENILPSIPPRHKVMEIFGECAAEFPEKFVEKITCPSAWWQVTPDKIEQAIIIKSAIALKKETKTPLKHLNECTDVVGNMLEQRILLISKLLKIIKNKRMDESHCRWMVDLMGRIQASVFSESSSSDSLEATLFLIDIFMCSCIALVGYDCFNKSLDDTINDPSIRFWLFPTALENLLSLPKWKEITPQVLEWVHKLSRWKDLPLPYKKILEQSILALRNCEYCSNNSKWQQLFDFTT